MFSASTPVVQSTGLFSDERVMQLKLIMTSAADATFFSLSKVTKTAVSAEPQLVAAWQAGLRAIRDWNEDILMQEVDVCTSRFAEAANILWDSFVTYVKETYKRETKRRLKVTRPSFRTFYHKFISKLATSSEVMSSQYLTLGTLEKDALIINTLRHVLMELSSIFVISLPIDDPAGEGVILSPRKVHKGPRVGPTPIQVQTPAPKGPVMTPANFKVYQERKDNDRKNKDMALAAITPVIVQTPEVPVMSSAETPLLNPLTFFEPTLTGQVPTPSVPTPSVPTPSVPTPSVPTPSVALSTVPTPSVPTPSVALSSVPTPSVPTPSVPTPSVPTPSVPTPSVALSSVPTPSVPTPSVALPPPSGTRPRASARVLPPATITRLVKPATPSLTVPQSTPDLATTPVAGVVAQTPTIALSATPVAQIKVVDLGTKGTPGSVRNAQLKIDVPAPSASMVAPQSFNFIRAAGLDEVETLENEKQD